MESNLTGSTACEFRSNNSDLYSVSCTGLSATKWWSIFLGAYCLNRGHKVLLSVQKNQFPTSYGRKFTQNTIQNDLSHNMPRFDYPESSLSNLNNVSTVAAQLPRVQECPTLESDAFWIRVIANHQCSSGDIIIMYCMPAQSLNLI